MDGTSVIAVMIFICIGILMITAFSNTVRAIVRIVLGAAVGMVGIYAVNMLFPSVNIGINIVTAAITGVLGVPGFVVLVLAGAIL